MLGRRLYGIKKAFRHVHKPEDWIQPVDDEEKKKKKKKKKKNWKSRVEWHWVEELDIRAIREREEGIEEVDKEVGDRMRKRSQSARGISEAAAALGRAQPSGGG